ncbi:zincin-like metallopeptidase domain-containing protein [Sphingopyxis sp. FD7]|uniref:zincin-like metallopeptidase domain-containing protein n=1 Tax=Sphingopyxis sp. FD7 TaxID=1914525 RepID=UPI000DC621A9|nr:zincin-like metallopeptidase domain-containing protein [Sphingopyxis sp. FD7]BBB11477.1 antirestriction protein [Sphingopyxis sp. FD7]
MTSTSMKITKVQFRAGLSGYVAELSSAMLGAELGLPVTHLDSHASYIDHWLKLLKDDDRAILTAAAKAEEASTLLLKLAGRIMPEQFDDVSDDAALAA